MQPYQLSAQGFNFIVYICMSSERFIIYIINIITITKKQFIFSPKASFSFAPLYTTTADVNTSLMSETRKTYSSILGQ